MAAFPNLENPVFTSAGTPFEFLWEDYREEYNVRGASSFLKARVAWADAGDFIADVMGYTNGTVGGSQYDRNLPLASPNIANQWCVDAKLLSYPSSTPLRANFFDPDQDPQFSGDGMFSSDWAIYGLTFTRLPFALLENNEISGFDQPELSRYCIPANRPRAREFTVKAWGLVNEADGSQYIGLPAFVMDREMDLTITQLQVPSELVPYSAINDCLGRINLADVELPIPPSQEGGLYTMRTFPAQTLLFRGIATDITDYPRAFGTGFYTDLPFYFTYRETGWRKLPKPTGDGEPITVIYHGISPTKYLYNTEQFNALFKPTV